MTLNINHLTTHYLRDISFTLENENLVILGSNGAGKTTLAQAIVHLLENESITIEDKKVSDLCAKERAKYLNFVPSKLEIFDEYIDVHEFLELSLLNGTPYEEIENVLRRLEIDHLKNKSCSAISSGESQLVLCASALLHNATLTLFDEPTANLDSDKKIKIFELLKNDDRFKIVITHDLNLAFKLGFRVIFLQHGAIVYDGRCEHFFEEENLNRLFGHSIRRVEDFFMVNYQ
ncbi:MAG: ABC transporter ATP-binding protein [Campylobacterales bacterium]|nr:ABC transporter ATP-binding protein [Campylobacterales bacterium]